MTFLTDGRAQGWLDSEERLIDRGDWTPPAERAAQAAQAATRAELTVRELCDRWLSGARLKESTVDSHRRQLDARVLCTDLADETVASVDRNRIRLWWAEVQDRWPDTGTANAHGYKRLHTAFNWAVDELEVIPANPVKIKGASVPPRPQVRDKPLITTGEAQALVNGVSARMKTPMELLLWCGLRLGELLELRRKDIRGLSGTGPVTLRIRRDAERLTEKILDPETGEMRNHQIMVSFDVPKTDAANRDVVVPPQVAGRLRDHCREYVDRGAESLVVSTATGKVMMDTSFRSRMTLGKRAAGREDVSPHDCRRFFGTMLVTNGVELEEARRLMGHETVAQLLEYLRAASGYEKRAADVLDALMPTETVEPGAPGDDEDQDNGKGDGGSDDE